MCSGSSFNNFGTATENGQSILSFSLVLGTLRSSWSADLRDRLGVQGCRSSERYDGARPFRDLKVKLILKWTGSQWSEAKIGEMCSNFLVSVKRCAAAFCTS